MLDGFGFDLLCVVLEKNFEVIFIIVYEEFVIKVIKFLVFDYILKLVDLEEFCVVVECVFEIMNEQKFELQFEVL